MKRIISLVVLIGACLILPSWKGYSQKVTGLKVMGSTLSFSLESDTTLIGTNTQTDPLPTQVELTFNQRLPVVIQGTPADDGSQVDFTTPVPEGIFPGHNQLIIAHAGKELLNTYLEIPNPLPNAGQQPMILQADWVGAFPGQSVTFTGKNFGSSLDQVYIWIGSAEGVPFDPGVNPVPVTWLTTPDQNKNQQISFILPDEPKPVKKNKKHTDGVLGHDLTFWVFNQGQPSATPLVMRMVPPNYRKVIFLIELGILVGLVLVTALITFLINRGKPSEEKFDWLSLIREPDSKKLSISKCQIVLWTLVLGVGYGYYALASYLVLKDNGIPDFDSGLLVLMGLGTAGSVVAQVMDRPGKKTASAQGKSSLTDLITQNDRVSISRLQLVFFTVITVIIYIVHLGNPEVIVNGMPAVPPTLMLLMGISQAGYLAGNAVENKNAEVSTPKEDTDPSA